MRLPHPSGANEQGVLGVLPGILLAGRRSTEILFHLLFPSDWMSLLETFANYHAKFSKNWSKEELNQIVGGKGLLRVSSGCTSPWHGINNHRSNEGTQPSTGAVGHDVIQVNAIQSRVAPDLHVTVIYPQSPWWLWALPLCAYKAYGSEGEASSRHFFKKANLFNSLCSLLFPPTPAGETQMMNS